MVNYDRLLHTPLCDLLDIRYPIVQAGMFYVAEAGLAAAVSKAGGLGVIGAAGMTGEELEAEIRKVRQETANPFGVDIILPAGTPDEVGEGSLPPNFREPPFLDDLRAELGFRKGEVRPRPLVTTDMVRQQIAVIFDCKVPVFVSGLGDPRDLVPRARQQGMKVMAVVGNLKAARRVAQGGVDAVVAQGHEAGGHTGQVGSLVLTPQVVDAVAPTPVLAAGGIADGRGLLAALMLGAVGVWVGTRFVATQESHAHAVWKERIVAAQPEDTKVTKYFTGKTNRVIRNRLLDMLEGSGLPALPMPYQNYLVDDVVSIARIKGNGDLMRLTGGQCAGLITEVKSAGEVIEDMVSQALGVLAAKLEA